MSPHSGPTCQLRHLDLLLEIPLEAGEEHLPLRWLEAVHEVGQRALVVWREEVTLLGGSLSAEEEN